MEENFIFTFHSKAQIRPFDICVFETSLVQDLGEDYAAFFFRDLWQINLIDWQIYFK